MIVKICGIKEPEHALLAAEAGADWLGFVFAPGKRQISPARAKEIIALLPEKIRPVGVFVNEKLAAVNDISNFCGLSLIQLHGDESPEYCRQVARPVIKAVRIRERSSLEALDSYREAADFFLLDTFVAGTVGGTGQSFDWSLARGAAVHGKFLLAGGLNPANVQRAIRSARPNGVDVSSGVETDGSKDLTKIRQFIQNARGRGNERTTG